MCGLAGFLDGGRRGADVMHDCVKRMVDTLRPRGPDGCGQWVSEGLALGHRRLSILDLSANGDQPMHSACDRFVIVFNGEIYNHLELRRDLEAAGSDLEWRGHSDTETLLAAIRCWGLDEALQRAKGMFALAIWDKRHKRLSLARDRIGEKPLYWGWAAKSFLFGSELKAIRAHPDFEGEICRGALAHYLRFAYVPAPSSIYENIFKLEPGCILEVNERQPDHPPKEPLRPGDTFGTLSIRRYWSLRDEQEAGTRNSITDEDHAVTELEGAISKAVQRQMLSDVPLGAFLSGGVDSSTIVSIMQAHSTQRVKTFTVGFEDAAFDESEHAAAVAQYLGTDHYALRVTDADARDVIPHLPQMYDEPFADPSQIPTHLVCRAARSQVTVALSGDGGDELFGGYNRHFWGPQVWNKLSRVPRPIRKALGATIGSIPVPLWDKFGNLHNAMRPNTSGIAHLGDKAHRVGNSFREIQHLDDLYVSLVSHWHSPEEIMLANGKAFVEPRTTLNDRPPETAANDPAGIIMYLDAMSYLPDDILCKVDRAAMAISLETRVPFLDPDVVSIATRLPPAMNIRGDHGKLVLRRVLGKHVPNELIERPKAGFTVPIGSWLRGPLRGWAEDLLSEDKLREHAFLNPEPIRKTWADHLSGKRDWTARLWPVLMFQAWLTTD